MLEVGSVAPDFVGPSSQGGTLRLSELTARGPVVLYFYSKNFSPVCTEEASLFRDNARRLQELGASVVGVSSDTVESHQAFVKALVLGYPLVSDPKRDIVRSFDVKTLLGLVDRVTYVLDTQRRVRLAYRSIFNVVGHLEATVRCVEDLHRAHASPEDPAAPLSSSSGAAHAAAGEPAT